MKINSINNNQTNFKGNFQKNSALESIIKYADKNSLGKFSDIIKRAAKINDGNLFSFSIYKSLELNSNATYNLHIKNTKENWNVTKSVRALSCCVLANFIPILEKYYPKTYNETKEELISEINKNLLII